MKQNHVRNEAGKADAPRPRPRFRIDRLEERIAPRKGGKGTNNCPTDTCGDFCGGTSSY